MSGDEASRAAPRFNFGRRAVRGACALLTICALILLVAPAAAMATSWNLAQDFAVGGAARSNPQADGAGDAGVWSFMEQTGTGSLPTNPSQYSLIPDFHTDCNGSGTGVYIDGGCGSGPAIGVNKSGATIQTSTSAWLANGQAGIYPLSDAWAIVAWRSPIEGTVSVSATLSPADANTGHTRSWALLEASSAAATSATTLESGTLAGSTANVSFGSSSSPVSVNPGTMLYVLVGPGPGNDFTYDSTVIDLTITGHEAAGNTYTVDSTSDTVDANPGDGICADAGGHCTLRAAIMESNADTTAGTNTITVPAGTYTLSLGSHDPSYSAPDVSQGDLDVTHSVRITGAGAGSTIVQAGDGSSTPIDRVFESWYPAVVRIADMTIRNGQPLANSYYQDFGGLVRNDGGSLTLDHDLLTGGTAYCHGGAVDSGEDYTGDGSGSLTITDSTISGNSAGPGCTGGNGGAVGVRNGNLTISGSTISGNTDTATGGGVELENSCVSTGCTTTSALLVNDTISGNTAGSGGGISFFSGTRGVLENVTIADNQAATGAGFYNDGTASVTAVNTLLASNLTGVGGSAANCSGTLTSLGHNLADDSTCALTGTGDQQGVDPQLGVLQDNGGASFTQALPATSPAVDSGDNASCPATDQRGVSRPQNATGAPTAICDIGAFELTGADTTPPTITIGIPGNGIHLPQGSTADAQYSCSDSGSGVATCVGRDTVGGNTVTVADGAALQTETAGAHTFEVTATDKAGNKASSSVSYYVDPGSCGSCTPDTTPPTVTITTPGSGAHYQQGQSVTASYSCHDEAGGSGLDICQGTVASGQRIDTRSTGSHSFQVVARDYAGNTTNRTITYHVDAPSSGGGGGGSVISLPCNKQVSVGPIAITGCIKQVGGNWVISGEAMVNGITLVPNGAGAELIFDPHRLTLAAAGAWKVQLGPVYLGKHKFGPWFAYSGKFVWTFAPPALPSLHLPVKLPLHIRLPGALNTSLPAIPLPTLPSLHFLGFPIQHDVSFKAVKGGALLTLNVGLPSFFKGLSGQLQLHASQETGVTLAGVHVAVPDAWAGPVEVKGTDLSYNPASNDWHAATQVVLPTPAKPQVGAGIDIVGGHLQALSINAGGLQLPIGPGVLLQEIDASLRVDPLHIGGTVSISAGPQIGGKSAASITGGLTYDLGAGGSKLEATGTLALLGVKLANASIDYLTRTDGSWAIDFGGQLGYVYTIPAGAWWPAIKIGAAGTVEGHIYGGSDFYLDAAAQITAPLIDATGEVRADRHALAGCASIWGVAAGFVYPWGGAPQPFHGCDLSAYVPVGRSASATAAAAGRSLMLPAHLPVAAIEITGAGGPPLLALHGPHGASLTMPSTGIGIRNASYLAYRDPQNATTYLLIRHPAAGRWSISQLPGSPAIVSVQSAQGLPKPQIHVHLVRRRHSHTELLHYTVHQLPGQRVRFLERGRGTSRSLGWARHARGTIAIRPAGSAGRRTVIAEVIQNGTPRVTLTVARYRAPSGLRSLARPRRLRVTRRGSGITVRFTAVRGASGYVVRAASSVGGTTQKVLPARRHLVRFGSVPAAARVRITVRAVSRFGAFGRQAAATVKPRHHHRKTHGRRRKHRR